MRERNLVITYHPKRRRYHVEESNVGTVFVSRKLTECEEYIAENPYRRVA